MSTQLAAAGPPFDLRRVATRASAPLVAAAALAMHLWLGHESFSAEARLSLGLVAAMVVLAGAFAPTGTVPALAYGLARLYATLGIACFSQVRIGTISGRLMPSQHAIDLTARAVLLYATLILASGWLFTRLLQPHAPRVLERFAPAGAPAARNARWLVAALSLAAAALGGVVARGVPGLAQVLTILGSPVVYLGLIVWNLQQESSHAARLALAGALFLAVGNGLLSGMLGQTLTPVLVLALLLWKVRGQLPITLAIFVAAAIVILTPVKHTYRTRAWYSMSALSVLDRAGVWLDAFTVHYGGEDTSGALEEATSATLSRLDTFGQVAQIVDWVPQRIPYDGPDQWLTTPLLLVPRLFWSDKPVQERFFNRRYTFLFRLQEQRTAGGTSITLPAVGDGYWRLGMGGVALEGVLAGAVYGLAQAIGSAAGPAALCLAATLALLQPEYHVFGSLNGILQRIAVVLSVIVLIQLLALLIPSPSSRAS